MLSKLGVAFVCQCYLSWRIYAQVNNNSVMSSYCQQMSHLTTKPTKWHVHQAKTQISLGICPVWSVFAACMKKAWVHSYPLSAQQRLWSDRAHMQFCWFCHEALKFIQLYQSCDACHTHSGLEHTFSEGYLLSRAFSSGEGNIYFSVTLFLSLSIHSCSLY